MSRLHKLERELSAQVLEAYARKLRLEKQYQAILAKLRVAGNRETQNIFELEMNEILSKAFTKLTKILNLSSPRSSSFLNFTLLDFSNRISAKSLSS
jgi:hypothetical protein